MPGVQGMRRNVICMQSTIKGMKFHRRGNSPSYNVRHLLSQRQLTIAASRDAGND